MIHDSKIEGMKIFTGNFATAVALFVIYVAYGRPPDQDESEIKNEYAISDPTVPSYYVLVCSQVVFFAASFLDLFFYQKSTIVTVIAIILQMVCLSQICSIFKFTQNPNDELDDLSKLNDA